MGRHPNGFDNDMEILATVPYSRPGSVRILAKDFGMSRGEMLAVLRNLSTYGVQVYRAEHEPDGVAKVVIPRRFHSDVTWRCEEYWHQTHENSRQIKRMALN